MSGIPIYVVLCSMILCSKVLCSMALCSMALCSSLGFLVPDLMPAMPALFLSRFSFAFNALPCFYALCPKFL